MMKGLWKRLLCMLLAVALIVPMVFSDSAVVLAAKKPTLNKKSKTITGVGSVYTLTVENQPENTTLTWSSSNNKVADVNGLGQVTAKAKGKTTITCLITYTDKSVMKLTCKVTVKVPATAVAISNANLVNNAHNMLVGETYDFNRKLTPTGSSDKTYWVIADEDIATVDSQGVVTALKAGATTLQARTGANKTAAMDPLNAITDSIILIVEEQTATVTKAEKTDDYTVIVQFSHAMTKSSLITTTGALNTGNVVIDGKKVNNVTAADLGTITPTLSSDGKTLTLKATNKWDGVYRIQIENDATTTSGTKFVGYDEEFDFSDNLIPAMVSFSIDDTGFIGLITFNKEIDITSMEVALDTSAQSSLNVVTQTVLTTTSNYKLRADKKTIQVDLSGISSTDYNKLLTFSITGIKDLKGNITQPYINTVYIYTDTSTKPNATLQYVERTSKNTLTAHFSKSIQFPGFITINNMTAYGTVDSEDKTCVNYTISDTTASSTGYLNGTIQGWYSYNTLTSAEATNFVVDMSVGAIPPTLTNYELVSTLNNNTTTNAIVLTYNKNVTLSNASGVLTSVYTDNYSNVNQYYLQYAATVKDNVVTIVIDPSTVIGTGLYQVTLPANFVYDSYYNFSSAYTISLTSSISSGTKLPAPTSIVQDVTDPSVINISFSKKLDLTTAQNVNNYAVDTVHPYSAIVTYNDISGATVQLRFASGTMRLNANYPVTIENVCGVSGTYTAMDKYTKIMQLKENVAPTLTSAKISGTTITLTFSENIQGTAAFNVYNYTTTIPATSIANTYIQDNLVYIVLPQGVYGTDIRIEAASNCVIKDIAGNKAALSGQVQVIYY